MDAAAGDRYYGEAAEDCDDAAESSLAEILAESFNQEGMASWGALSACAHGLVQPMLRCLDNRLFCGIARTWDAASWCLMICRWRHHQQATSHWRSCCWHDQARRQPLGPGARRGGNWPRARLDRPGASIVTGAGLWGCGHGQPDAFLSDCGDCCSSHLPGGLEIGGQAGIPRVHSQQGLAAWGSAHRWVLKVHSMPDTELPQ